MIIVNSSAVLITVSLRV